jgi:hypothetical protein
MCRYENLWEVPIVSVGYSFGGVMLKSLVVEVLKHMHQRMKKTQDVVSQESCKKKFENLKGMAFNSVSHGGGSQCLQINVIDKKVEHESKSFNSFN